MVKIARKRVMSAQRQRLVCEQERTRQALLKEVKEISLWGLDGVGRKSGGEVLEEALTRISKLDLSYQYHEDRRI